GGVVDLSQVTTIPGGHVQVIADGTGSEVDLLRLTSFTKTGVGTSFLQTKNGGLISFGSSSPDLTDVDVTLSPGTRTASDLVLASGDTLSGVGKVSGSATNAGSLKPGATVGAMTISGDYTQKSTGALVIELGGRTAATQYDQLNVGGLATLGGT